MTNSGSTPGRTWPIIDPKVLRMGVSKIRTIDSEWLHQFAANGEIAVIQTEGEPLSVLVPYAIYQSMQAPLLEIGSVSVVAGEASASPGRSAAKESSSHSEAIFETCATCALGIPCGEHPKK